MVATTIKSVITITRAVPNIPVADLERAKKFYEEKLGFKIVREDPSPGVALDWGGGRIYLYKGEPSTGKRPSVNFVVDEIEPNMKELKENGIVFQDFEMLGIKTVNGLFTMGDYKMASFRDSEGNVISLSNA